MTSPLTTIHPATDIHAVIDQFVTWIMESGTKPDGYVYFADTPGRRYTRIVMDSSPGARFGKSVHCFIDNATGDVLKAAGYKGPAKGARGNLVRDFDAVVTRWDWTGGYLYR